MVDDFIGRVIAVAVVFFQSEIRILHDCVVLNLYIIHHKLAVVYADAVQTVAIGLVVGNGDVVAVVNVQPFAVVVIGLIVGEGNVAIVAARHRSDTIAGTAVGFMAVAF